MPNLLAILTLVAAGIAIVVFAAIAINPNISLNPYPPTTPSPSPPASTPTERGTAAPTPTQTSTSTPAPPASPSPTRVQPATPTPSPTPALEFGATVEIETSADCATIVIAGTVSDEEGEPLAGYPVHVWGPETERVVLSGSAEDYGPSGWEVVITIEPIEQSDDSWYAQLHRLNTFSTYPPLSPIIPVPLSENCEENLAVIDFQEREK